jgi:hypothetical protein
MSGVRGGGGGEGEGDGMRRRLFTLASAVSFLLLIPAVMFWIRSQRTQDYAIKGLAGPDTLFVNSGHDWLSLSSAGTVLKYKGGWIFNSIPDTAVTAYRPFIRTPPSQASNRRPTTVQPAFHIPGLYIFNVTGVMILPERPSNNPPRYQTLWMVCIHYAWLTGITAALPAVWLAVWVRRITRRPGRGHCRKCFYDLTGNVSGVCPECGTAVAGKAGT